MPIKLPEEIVYYFEISPVRDRLLYFIPEKELISMVKNGKVHSSIVKDYPDGVEIKVSEDALEEFRKRYDLQLNLDINSLLQAFKYLKSKSGRDFPKTGFIKKGFLEDLAAHLNSEIKVKKITPISGTERFKLFKPKKKKAFLKNQVRVQRKIDLEMNKIKYKPFNPKIPLVEQDFFNVKMSKGEEASTYFMKLQQDKERRR